MPGTALLRAGNSGGGWIDMITIRGRQAIFRIKNLNRLTKAGIEHGSYVSGRGLVSSTSKAILARNKTGRIYRLRTAKGRRRTHRASAPGETHANLSGRLRRSLSFKVSPSTLEFGYGVTKQAAPEYAEWVEFGTGRMKPRPSLQNGIKAETRNMVRNYRNEVGKRIGLQVMVR